MAIPPQKNVQILVLQRKHKGGGGGKTSIKNKMYFLKCVLFCELQHNL
jgi:hypothetical protein